VHSLIYKFDYKRKKDVSKVICLLLNYVERNILTDNTHKQIIIIMYVLKEFYKFTEIYLIIIPTTHHNYTINYNVIVVFFEYKILWFTTNKKRKIFIVYFKK
jgi:hypothetical protein